MGGWGGGLAKTLALPCKIVAFTSMELHIHSFETNTVTFSCKQSLVQLGESL